VAEFFNSRPGSPSEARTKGFAERTTVVRAVVLLIFWLCIAKILPGPEINSFHTFLSGSICYDWCSCVATSD
jgi:hypothetical protein